MTDPRYKPIADQMRAELEAARKSHDFWLAQPAYVVPSPSGVMYDFREQRLVGLRTEIHSLEDAIAILEKP